MSALTRNLKRRSTRINREMGRVQWAAVVADDQDTRLGLTMRWERLHRISGALADRMGMTWMV